MDSKPDLIMVVEVECKDLASSLLESRVRERAPAYFARLLRQIQDFALADLVDRIEKAAEQGRITDEERIDALEAEVVVQGSLKTGEERLLVARVMDKLREEDVQRVVRQARSLAKVMDLPVIPAVVGRQIAPEAQQAAQRLGVEVMLVED